MCRVIPKSNHEPLENRRVKRARIDEGFGFSRQKSEERGWGEGEESAEGNAVGAGEMSAFVGFSLSPAPQGCPFANPHKSVQKTNRYKDASPSKTAKHKAVLGRQS